MKTKFIEVVSQNEFNWGKFMLARYDEDEWARRSVVDPNRSLIAGRGWTSDHLWVLDLQTGEGAMFMPGGDGEVAAVRARVDLNEKHQIWVCPMFEPFLVWLYAQDISDLDALPGYLALEGDEAMYGHRREGKKGACANDTPSASTD